MEYKFPFYGYWYFGAIMLPDPPQSVTTEEPVLQLTGIDRAFLEDCGIRSEA